MSFPFSVPLSSWSSFGGVCCVLFICLRILPVDHGPQTPGSAMISHEPPDGTGLIQNPSPLARELAAHENALPPSLDGNPTYPECENILHHGYGARVEDPADFELGQAPTPSIFDKVLQNRRQKLTHVNTASEPLRLPTSHFSVLDSPAFSFAPFSPQNPIPQSLNPHTSPPGDSAALALPTSESNTLTR